MIARIIVLSLLYFADPAHAASLTQVRSCRLVDGSQMTLLAEATVDGNRLHLRINERTEKAFTDMPDADFVGAIVLAACIDHSLIFAINYGSPYLKGAVIRKNPVSHRLERINFAEKALPRWLYVNSQEMQLIIPNIGYEVQSKYIVYQFSTPDGQATEPLTSDTPPSRRGFKKLTIIGTSSTSRP